MTGTSRTTVIGRTWHEVCTGVKFSSDPVPLRWDRKADRRGQQIERPRRRDAQDDGFSHPDRQQAWFRCFDRRAGRQRSARLSDVDNRRFDDECAPRRPCARRDAFSPVRENTINWCSSPEPTDEVLYVNRAMRKTWAGGRPSEADGQPAQCAAPRAVRRTRRKLWRISCRA